MSAALVLSAALMGLAGTAHCVGMCGAACGAISGPGRGWMPLHAGRLISYAAAGAVAAASVGALASVGQAVAALKPLWTLVHLAALGLGLFLLWQGRQPAWMERVGSARLAGSAAAGSAEAAQAAWQPVQGPSGRVAAPGQKSSLGPWRRGLAGLAWVAWPCGLLQSALLVAALANSPLEGAAVMAAFALTSSAGLVLGPALWWRMRGPSGDRAGASAPWAVRLAGAVLAAASAWALGHGLWMRFVSWCMT